MRLHGRNAAQWWTHDAAEDRYNYLYSADELQPFAETAIAARALVKKVYLYANNHFSAKSVANAVAVKHLARRDHFGRVPAGVRRALSRSSRPLVVTRAGHGFTYAFFSTSATWRRGRTSMPLITCPNTVYFPFNFGFAASVT